MLGKSESKANTTRLSGRSQMLFEEKKKERNMNMQHTRTHGRTQHKHSQGRGSKKENDEKNDEQYHCESSSHFTKLHNKHKPFRWSKERKMKTEYGTYTYMYLVER